MEGGIAESILILVRRGQLLITQVPISRFSPPNIVTVVKLGQFMKFHPPILSTESGIVTVWNWAFLIAPSSIILTPLGMEYDPVTDAGANDISMPFESIMHLPASATMGLSPVNEAKFSQSEKGFKPIVVTLSGI